MGKDYLSHIHSVNGGPARCSEMMASFYLERRRLERFWQLFLRRRSTSLRNKSLKLACAVLPVGGVVPPARPARCPLNEGSVASRAR